jgi:glycosyltransferase involved in cell wall biosynthesis
MRVVVSVGGRFHAFNLAAELEKRGALMRLITSYPKFEVVKYGIPKERIRSKVIKEITERAWACMPASFRNMIDPRYFFHELYDQAACRAVISSDVFVGWSGFSLYSLRKARSLGAKVVVERGSSHIEYQRHILREEYERYGIKEAWVMLPHPRVVEKELREYEEADYLSIPSQFVRRTFLAAGISEEKLVHVPYGVDLSRFRQVPKEDKIFRVVFAGGMTLRKGVHYLLQAFAELKLSHSELLLIGAMNDEMEPFFKKYSGTFRYIGKVPQEELYRYYSQGSVFAMMSIEEGLALVIPQAMACGLPIIATTNTGAEDIVRDGMDGFIIPIRDVEALKVKLLHLYENPDLRARMGRSAKEHVASGFTWDDYGGRVVKEYERIVASRS